jgi:hypothetical protein
MAVPSNASPPPAIAVPSNAPPPAIAVPPAPKPEPLAPRIGLGPARAAAEQAFTWLVTVLPGSPRIEYGTILECAGGRCVWRSSIIQEDEVVLGMVEVDGMDGDVTFAPADGRNERYPIEEFLAREKARQKAVAAVEQLPVVRSFCTRLRALKLGCVVYFEEEPSEQDCGKSPPLDSSCWMRVTVLETHETHSTRFGTFLVAPEKFRVVGALGYCGVVPIARFHGPGDGCTQ